MDWSIETLTPQEYVRELSTLPSNVPIEQTPAWLAVDATDPDRHTAGAFRALNDGVPQCVFILTRMLTHGARYFWIRSGPVWVTIPTKADEDAFAAALIDYLRSFDRLAMFVRLNLAHQRSGARPPENLLTYDSTVVIDISETPGQGPIDEQILARFKPRGRRDVRKSIRESGLECAEETQAAGTDFAPYFDLMADTAQRDGFVPWPSIFYQNLIEALGPQHCRVFAGRIDGELVCWSIVTVSGRWASRYYAASASAHMRRRVTDRLVFFECVTLAQMGMTSYDLMGIGSGSESALSGLNEFKTKFAKNTVSVAPAYDFTLRPVLFRTFMAARSIANRGA